MLKHEIYFILCVSVTYLVMNTQLFFRAELSEKTTVQNHRDIKEKRFKYILYWNEAYDSKGNLT